MPKFFKWCDGTVSNVDEIINIEIDMRSQTFALKVLFKTGDFDIKFALACYDDFYTQEQAQAEIDRFHAFVQENE